MVRGIRCLFSHQLQLKCTKYCNFKLHTDVTWTTEWSIYRHWNVMILRKHLSTTVSMQSRRRLMGIPRRIMKNLEYQLLCFCQKPFSANVHLHICKSLLVLFITWAHCFPKWMTVLHNLWVLYIHSFLQGLVPLYRTQDMHFYVWLYFIHIFMNLYRSIHKHTHVHISLYCLAGLIKFDVCTCVSCDQHY